MSGTDESPRFDDDQLSALISMTFDDLDGDVPHFAREAERAAFALRDSSSALEVLSDSAFALSVSGVRDIGDERIVRWHNTSIDIELRLSSGGRLDGQMLSLSDGVAVRRLTVESGLTDRHRRDVAEVDEFGFFQLSDVLSPLRLRIEFDNRAAASAALVTEWIWR